MLRNPCNKLFGGIFLFINALRRRNDGFDCHTLTSQSKVSTYVQYVGGYVREYGYQKKMTRTNTEHIIKWAYQIQCTSEKRPIRKTLQSCLQVFTVCR